MAMCKLKYINVLILLNLSRHVKFYYFFVFYVSSLYNFYIRHTNLNKIFKG